MKDFFDFFTSIFLFKNMKKEQLQKIIGELKPELRSYSRAALIYSPESYEKQICFIYSGECGVLRKKPDGTDVLLNVLYPGDSFGILAALSDEEEFPTAIVARHSSKVLFLKRDELFHLIKRYPTVAMNVIEFLTQKIGFLNSRIATFSADSVEEKLSRYILSNSNGKEEIDFNCKKCSEAINSGRASVYRGLELLENAGLIKYENKKIYIIDRKGLERTKK